MTQDFGSIIEQLHFNPSEGRIWLQGRRMALVPLEMLGCLRRDLVNTIGKTAARQLLTQRGYAAGVRDAILARKHSGPGEILKIIDSHQAVPMLQGFVQSELVRLELRLEQRYCYVEAVWNDGCEDDIQIATEGMDNSPACWMGVGYKTGFLSEIMGTRILAREVECRAMGHPQCRVIAQPLAEWDDPEEDLYYLDVAPASAPRMLTRRIAPDPVAESAAKARPNTALLGASVGFTAAQDKMRRVAGTQATVLLLGESGVGKSAFAREVHNCSRRAGGPFVEFNCASIPESLLEAELFGVERGAYSGASEARAGRFEAANGGTLFLDEIGTLSFSAQGKLLRVLQSSEIERLGSTRTIKLDVRVVAATNENLPKAVQEGRFREDLYYRINVFPINLPPLRERRDDLPQLLDYFVERFSALHNRRITGITPRALEGVLNHDWPGNIRELENAIERGIILANDDESLDTRHLFSVGTTVDNPSLMRLTGLGSLHLSKSENSSQGPAQNVAASRAMPLEHWVHGAVGEQGMTLAAVEEALVSAALDKTNGNISRAAQLLGLSRAQISYRVKQGQRRTNQKGPSA